MAGHASQELKIRKLPIWKHEPIIAPLHGGLSNESFVVTDGAEKYVLRFGQDFPFHHVSRQRELMTALAASAAGFAPDVVYAEPGIMVSRFIDGKTYTEADVRNNTDEITRLIRRFHETMSTRVSGSGFMFWVFHVIRDYARTLEAGHSRLIKELPRYLELAAHFEAAQVPMPIVFGHHDLLPANFIHDGSRLWLIDFEYAGFGTAMFDLAGITSNAGFDQLQTSEFITAYLGHKPGPDFLHSYSAMSCASLLREAMWSMVSELHLNAPGVDYVAYTTENLERFKHAFEAYQNTYGKI